MIACILWCQAMKNLTFCTPLAQVLFKIIYGLLKLETKTLNWVVLRAWIAAQPRGRTFQQQLEGSVREEMKLDFSFSN